MSDGDHVISVVDADDDVQYISVMQEAQKTPHCPQESIIKKIGMNPMSVPTVEELFRHVESSANTPHEKPPSQSQDSSTISHAIDLSQASSIINLVESPPNKTSTNLANSVPTISMPGGQNFNIQYVNVEGGQVLSMMNNTKPVPVQSTDINVQNMLNLVNLNPVPTQIPQTMIAPLNDGEEPLYVNAKQYHRILKRREARAKLEALGKVQRQRQRYQHESRHRHAMQRVRGQGGKFTKRGEAQKENQPETNDSPSHTESQHAIHYIEIEPTEDSQAVNVITI